MIIGECLSEIYFSKHQDKENCCFKSLCCLYSHEKEQAEGIVGIVGQSSKDSNQTLCVMYAHMYLLKKVFQLEKWKTELN